MERFEFMCNLGEGAYGTVWKCLDKDTNQMVAMKRFKEAHLDEEVMHLALREIRLLKACAHPNVVALNEAFKSKSGRVYMVMEHVDHTLTEELRKQPRGFRPLHAKLVAWQLLHAAAFLHANKVIHRDLKPANILLTPELTVKLCDFGFARTLTPEDIADYTQYVVTRWYRPPEILVGAPYGSSVDVWAIGCLLCEMCTGRPLFPGSDTLDQLHLTMRTLGQLPHDQMARLRADSHLAGVVVPTQAQIRPLETRYPLLPPDVLEVLHACLCLEPARRLSALEVASLPYFDDVYDYVAGTSLQAECDEAYEAAVNNNTVLAQALYPRTSEVIHARSAAAAMRREAATAAAASSAGHGHTAGSALRSVHFRDDVAAEAPPHCSGERERGRRFSTVTMRCADAVASLPDGKRPALRDVAGGIGGRSMGGIGGRSMGAPQHRRMTVNEGNILGEAQPEESGLQSAGTALSKAQAAAAAAAATGAHPPQAPTNIHHNFGDVPPAPAAPGPLPMVRSVNARAAHVQAMATAAINAVQSMASRRSSGGGGAAGATGGTSRLSITGRRSSGGCAVVPEDSSCDDSQRTSNASGMPDGGSGNSGDGVLDGVPRLSRARTLSNAARSFGAILRDAVVPSRATAVAAAPAPVGATDERVRSNDGDHCKPGLPPQHSRSMLRSQSLVEAAGRSGGVTEAAPAPAVALLGHGKPMSMSSEPQSALLVEQHARQMSNGGSRGRGGTSGGGGASGGSGGSGGGGGTADGGAVVRQLSTGGSGAGSKMLPDVTSVPAVR